MLLMALQRHAMLPASIAAVLSLAHLLCAKPLDCNLVPETIDNATLAKLQGKWFFLVGAFQNTSYQQEMEQMQNVYFFLDPSPQDDQFYIRDYIRMKTQKCVVVTNTSTISAIRGNSTVTRHEGNQTYFAQLMKSSEDTMILKYDDGGLSLSARTQNVTKERQEEFTKQMLCMGLKEERILHFPDKDFCPMEEKKENQPPLDEMAEQKLP